ncbi:MAG: ATP-dependent helicase HrpB, partial [Lentisphaeria bacterium]|nr:ATP-dependent helicase HrpB [Lentisphaeria bacterium]
MREAFDPASTCLPVAEVIGELENALTSKGRAVLCAPPGGGKSTLVPPSLLGKDFLHGGRILMLEPRRLAARNTSKRIAFLLKSAPGEIVGCHTRFDHIGNRDVPIDVVTEGVLLRMIQNDPALTGVGLVIFDEFHERSIEADLGLALTLESASALREDLKILVMSATLDAEKTASLLKDENDSGNVPVIVSQGKMFPVETFYSPPDPRRDLAGNVCSAVADALGNFSGDILVFLPGEGEIRQCLKRLETTYPDRANGLLHFHPLYGNLPPEEQDAAFRPAPEKERKVILATSIAETSLTVENVRIVIDSGLMRCAVYSPASGMDHLETRRVSRASADQRRGRAGRTAPGVCFRLWHISEERGMLPFNVPGIREADLASFALQIAQWGILPSGVNELKLLDPPPKGAMEQAWSLLFQLGAVDPESGRITPYGKELSKYALHPRLAHMVLAAEKAGKRPLGCAIAALLQEKDILPKCASADLLRRLEALLPGGGGVPGRDTDSGALHRVENILANEFHIRKNGLKKEEIFSSAPGKLLAFAYPDRIGRRNGKNNEVLLANGKSCLL